MMLRRILTNMGETIVDRNARVILQVLAQPLHDGDLGGKRAGDLVNQGCRRSADCTNSNKNSISQNITYLHALF